MKLKMKRLSLILPIALAVVAAVILLVVLQPRTEEPAPPDVIHAWFHLHETRDRQALTTVLRDFESLYPRYTIAETILPYQDMLKDARTARSVGETIAPDVIVLSGPDLDEYDVYLTEPRPWTGSLWQLYFSRTAVESAGIDPDNLSALDWPGFYDLLLSLKAGGYLPVSIGAKFGWPWLPWLQHLSITASANPVSPDLEAGIALWQDMESAGIVPPDYRESGWAASVLNMAEGNGLFLLFNETVITPLDPETRTDIGSIPFPGSITGPPPRWKVGSFFYLCAPDSGENGEADRRNGEADRRNGEADRRNGEAALLLFEFLTSEGVTERFNRQASSPIFEPGFFPEDITLLPSMSEQVMDPDIAPYLNWLRSHKFP